MHRQADLQPVTLDVGTAVEHALADEVGDLANVEQQGYPQARASYTFLLDSPAKAIDGQDLHIDTPSSRWTNYGSPNAVDGLVVGYGVPTPVSDLRISFYDDGGGVRTPDSYDLEYLGVGGRWQPLPGQQRIRLAVAVETPQSGLIPVRPNAAVQVTTTIKASTTTVVSPELLVPDAWKAVPRRAIRPTRVETGKTLRIRWLVTAPAELPDGLPQPLRLVVRSRGNEGGAVRHQCGCLDAGELR
ncbi:hypothetical protein [Streptomyces sp. NPDC057616]|uniref:hypothetical protein n=1 Tax=Streptomyces sp. NPDC057616 TaxID=3346183 RepID=UPI00369A990B